MSSILALAALLTSASSPGATSQVGEAAGQCCTATIRVRVPEGTGTVYVGGSLPQLGPWHADGLALTGEGRDRSAEITAPPGTTFEYKITLGSWDREALSPEGTVPPNYQLRLDRDTVVVHEITDFKDPRRFLVDWRGSGVQGRLVNWTDVPSAFLGPTRHVEIWLPPGYLDAQKAEAHVPDFPEGEARLGADTESSGGGTSR